MTANAASARNVPATNTSHIQISVFILIGIPGLEDVHTWISVPFSFIYLISVVGNSIILFIIRSEGSLHQPMYFFLCMLAGTDLVISNTVLPKALGIFWLNSRDIHFNCCLIQMYVAHVFTSVESGIVSLMALDRYFAICSPLRYASILTNQRIAILGLACLLKSALYFAPYPYLMGRLTYCENKISHTFCEHISVAKLACTDITVNITYGLTVILLTGAQDISFIVISYVMILRAVFRLSTKENRWKALSTCMSHACVMTVFYVPVLFTVFIQRFAHDVLPCIHILVANIYFLLPPMVNPLVYGIRTQQIRVKMLRMLNSRRNVCA
ncbi:olfactory receptor 52E5-like [Pleurodeles waltl]|uniref:olfactory receptor 52E5-like n=1 Tax=Pleurodeles waltl TaxID=8319 RepID=UPI0037096820